MDDCYLAKLSVRPWALTPAFNKDVLEYNVTVPSQQEKITFDLSTSDHGASFSISGSGGTRDVPLVEGTVTAIKIEVTSEDGHVKNYIVNVKRLSAKEAVLSNLAIQNGLFEPHFNPNVLLYYCLLPCNLTAVDIIATAPDPRSIVKVLGQDSPKKPIFLNPGLTIIVVEVTSPDGSNKKVYEVEVAKKQIPRYVKFVDSKALADFECPISLSPFYCPISIKGSNPKRTYSGPVFTEITRLSKIDPLSGEHLESGWTIQDLEVDQALANQMAIIPLTYSGSTKPLKFGELDGVLAECNQTIPLKDLAGAFNNSALSISRSLQDHKWQKALQKIFDETNIETLMALAETSLKDYLAKVPKPGQYHQQYAEGNSPMDALQHAIHCLATAAQLKSKNAEIHFKLATALEEKYWAEDMFGFKKMDKEDAPSPTLNHKAKESSKEEEVYAICKLKGVDTSEPVSHHLKALDNEYHHLIETGQSAKADHVMALYAWYSKKVSQEGASAHKAEDNDSPLGQAYQKYLDALCLDEVKAVYNFHVGRLLVIMGNYEDAIKRLEAALCWNSAHELARFYLGLAISLSKREWKTRSQEAIMFLQDGMELLLTTLSKEALAPENMITKTSLLAENLVRVTNAHFLRGIIQLGILLTDNNVPNAMAPSDVFHTAALLACQVLPNICRGDLYKQVEWVLVDAHTELLELLIPEDVTRDFIASRCKRLSALIFHSTISGNARLLELQERTCQKLVKIQPCVSYSLFLLGSAQFALYEQAPDGEAAMELLNNAKASFLASIELEGKPCIGEIPKLITDQNWWKISSSTISLKSTASSKGGKALAASKRSGLQLPSKGDKCKTYSPSSKRPAASSVSTPKSNTQVEHKSTVITKTVKPAKNPKSDKNELKDSEEDASRVTKNVPSYEARLGLARVLRAANDPSEAKKYYIQVIRMAPEVHDAYIECAEMLTKSNPLEAVDIYSQFPVSQNPTFDDAYIFGEIVNILMKAEQYEDRRLATNMIAYGKVLGIGVLEKYTKILEQRNKNNVLRTVYAGIHNKHVDDPEMQAFFKFKFWL